MTISQIIIKFILHTQCMQHTLLLTSVNFFSAKIKVIALNMTFIIKKF